MLYIDLIEQQETYSTALLIKPNALKKGDIEKHYLSDKPIPDIIAFGLEQGTTKKPSNKVMREYCSELLPYLKELGIKNLLVADANYFKLLVPKTPIEESYGYIHKCKLEGYEDLNIVYLVNYQGLFYNPILKDKISLSLNTFHSLLEGNTIELGKDIIHYSNYPNTYEAIKEQLELLHQYPALTCDIETFSLHHWIAGIGTIGFAWSQHEGVAFKVDYMDYPFHSKESGYGYQTNNEPVYQLLREFFESYKGTLIFHNCNFDIRVLIYVLYMDHLLDQKGLLKGLHTLHRAVEDTKIIKYLATNTCAKNPLDLKSSAHEFTGKYAQEDIKDITKIPSADLLEYNIVDCLATWYVFNKYMPIVVRDKQEKPYRELLLPSAKVINQMQLTGMCMDMSRILEVEGILIEKRDSFLETIMNHPLLNKAVYTLRITKWEKDYQNRKTKAKNPDMIKYKDFDTIEVEFNPNSGKQLIELLYNQLGLPIIDFTKTKQPSTGADTLKKLINHTEDPEAKDLLSALIEYSKVEKILTSFIPVFKAAPKGCDGYHYLFGNFNIGGTKSGRLSSSNPNLQNLPSGSTYGKLIKSCFVAPEGYVFYGSDYNSLESVINTLLTKDPEKEKILIDKYDSHSFNTYYYWPDEFKDLDPNSVESINSIKKSDHPFRGKSKPVSFALQYFGTYHTLMNNSGFAEQEAKAIEANYHKLYHVSMKWADDKINLASKLGYAELAFGVRLRTPVLNQVVMGIKKTPTEASAEYRTVGNAISGQSYGLLMNKAIVDFMERVWVSPYAETIKPCSLIHDAAYGYCPEDLDQIHWLNNNLIECMAWQDLPELQHDQIKIGSELDIHYKGWHQPITLENNISKEEIINTCKAGATKYEEK